MAHQREQHIRLADLGITPKVGRQLECSLPLLHHGAGVRRDSDMDQWRQRVAASPDHPLRPDRLPDLDQEMHIYDLWMMHKARALLATALLLLAIGGVNAASATSAQAWPWDPHVRVIFNVSACAGSTGQWGWYEGGGESGWVTWNDGYQGYFDLWKVSTSGSVTSIKWGRSGTQCGVRYFNITRPTSGTTVALGWIG